MPKKLSQSLVAFYLGEAPDSEGRLIEDIWSWDYERLEYVHDYIQWLFPLRTTSSFNLNAPTLTDQAIKLFKTNKELSRRLIRSLELMLKFYGLRCTREPPQNITIEKSDQYSQRKINWVRAGNHNYLRLTRILISLNTLGLRTYALSLFDCLDKIHKEEGRLIGNTTYSYWKEAIWN